MNETFSLKSSPSEHTCSNMFFIRKSITEISHLWLEAAQYLQLKHQINKFFH